MEPSLPLHDLAVPEPVSLVPQAIGWWIVAAIVLVGVAVAAIGVVRRRRANRYRREALARLRTLEAELAESATRAAAAARLPALVKQTALAAQPRAEVAGLSGEPWLALLDDCGGGRAFREGPGRLLPTLAYAPSADVDAIPPGEIAALVKVVRRWIRRHRARA